jgi:hypothetical protein
MSEQPSTTPEPIINQSKIEPLFQNPSEIEPLFQNLSATEAQNFIGGANSGHYLGKPEEPATQKNQQIVVEQDNQKD